MRSSKYDFSKIEPRQTLSIEEMKEMMKSKKIINNGKLNSNIQLSVFILNRNLLEFFENVYWYTNFMKKDANVKQRLFCIWNSIFECPKCKLCGKISRDFSGNFTNGWFNAFCSRRCNILFNYPRKFLSKYKKKKMLEKMSKTRKERYPTLPKEWRDKLRIAAGKSEVKNKKKQTCLIRYGIENPGVLGAFHSKAATNYIKDFIKERNIDINCCYYYDPKLKKKEFFQMIEINGSKRYSSYDLVVFENKKASETKDLSKISLVLEYNGPWHYRKEDIIGHEQEPALPYKSVNIKKIEQYDLDILKIKHMLKYTKNFFIYWWKEKKLYPVTECFDV